MHRSVGFGDGPGKPRTQTKNAWTAEEIEGVSPVKKRRVVNEGRLVPRRPGIPRTWIERSVKEFSCALLEAWKSTKECVGSSIARRVLDKVGEGFAGVRGGRGEGVSGGVGDEGHTYTHTREG